MKGRRAPGGRRLMLVLAAVGVSALAANGALPQGQPRRAPPRLPPRSRIS